MAASDPFAWLGLLKWSLAYSDGTSPTSEDGVSAMTAEDRAFLEKVMKEGIIDENERMKEILKQVTAQIEDWRAAIYTKEEADDVEDLLQELRDIVEQIDYARAFAAMKGLVFLLGCVQEQSMPKSTRGMCLGIIATMCQHNPPVQKELLELGALGILSDLFFATNAALADDEDGSLRARIIQAVSANVRSHDLAESVFCRLEQAPRLIAAGLGKPDDPDKESETIPAVVRKRTLFFLRALVTSDTCTRDSFQTFGACIVYAIDSVLLRDTTLTLDAELVELVLAMIEQILEQRVGVDLILLRKDAIAATGVQRVTAIQSMTGDEHEYAQTELEHWKQVLSHLAAAQPDASTVLVAA